MGKSCPRWNYWNVMALTCLHREHFFTDVMRSPHTLQLSRASSDSLQVVNNGQHAVKKTGAFYLKSHLKPSKQKTKVLHNHKIHLFIWNMEYRLVVLAGKVCYIRNIYLLFPNTICWKSDTAEGGPPYDHECM